MTTRATIALILALTPAMAAAQVAGPRPTKPGNLTVFLTGDQADAVVDLSQGPGALLMGGSTEVTKAFRDRIFPRMPGGDIVVLRTNNSSAYNDYFYSQITTGPNRPNSVETMVVNTRAKANSDYVEWVLATAEFIWMAGGDQSQYTDNWRGTKVEAQLRAAWQRGAFIGGTSAGMAVTSSFIYDPGSASSLTTASAAADPYNASMRITGDLIGINWLANSITDTHFKERDRMGRLMGMMAYLRQEGRADGALRAVAASEQCGIFIDRNGMGFVDTNTGRDAVYILEETPETARVQVAAGQPLVYTGVRRYRLPDGATFNFATGVASVPALTLSIDGRNSGDVYTPADPYIVAPEVPTPSPSPSPSPSAPRAEGFILTGQPTTPSAGSAPQ